MRSFLSVLMVLLVSGCALSMGDMASNRYSGVVPQPINKSYAGLWTGTNGSDSITLRIDEDGRGVSCSSRNGRDSVSNIKLANGTLYLQDGTKMDLVYADGYINGVSPSSGVQNVRFFPDNGLVKASPYCRNRIQRPYL